MMKILGVDPGTRKVGFGIIDLKAQGKFDYIVSGVIELKSKDMFCRLNQIQKDLVDVINQFLPDMMVIEKMFLAYNPDTAVKLGQARGIAIASAHRMGIKVFEYGVNEVKKHVTGYGKCSKQLMQESTKRHLKLTELPGEDAADALGLAICHGLHIRI